MRHIKKYLLILIIVITIAAGVVSLTTGNEKVSPTRAVYTFYSLDGRTSYCITLRRFRWQGKTAASPDERIWVPVRSEKFTRSSLD